MWRQVWSREVSVPGRLLRLLLIVMYAPVLLAGLIFRPWRKARQMGPSQATDDDSSDEPQA